MASLGIKSILYLPTTMQEAHVHPDTSVTLHTVPLPTLTSPHHILIQVHAAGCNPKDWKMPAGILQTISDCPNSGDDISGTIVALGSSAASTFRIGDRVAGLHELGAPGGAYAEYAVVHDVSTFRIPDHWGFEKAAGLPMIAYMGAIGFFGMLRVVRGPWEVVEEGEERPLLVYGAASGVGSMVVKLAVAMGVHPVICVAGRGTEFVEGIIERARGDAIVDYRGGSEKTVEGIRTALGGRKLLFAFDAVSEKDSFANIAQVLDEDEGRVTLVLPQVRDEFKREQQSNTMAGMLFKRLESRHVGKDVGEMGSDCHGQEFGYMVSGVIGRWIASGKLVPHPFEVVDGGLDALEGSLKRLREGKVSAKKLVVKLKMRR